MATIVIICTVFTLLGLLKGGRGFDDGGGDF